MGKNKKLIFSLFKLVLVLLICFLGYSLRIKNYSTIPRPGESLDEYANAWSGLGLIQLGIPLGWSYIISPNYQPSFYFINVDNVYQTGLAFANPFYIHKPWLDHPPGMGLLTGGFGYLKGARALEDASAVFIRKPIVLVGTLSIFLLFVLVNLYFNYPTAILSALIYATSPLIVVSSRMSQSENVFLPLFLLSAIFIRLFQTKQKYFFLVLSAFFAGVGVWFKIPAAMISVSGFFLILVSTKKGWLEKIKLAFSFGWMSLILGVLPLLAYGLALDPKAFFEVISFHSQRNYGIGIPALYNLLTQSKITNLVFLTDGWVFVGWLSWLILLVVNKNKTQKSLISIPLFISIIFYIFLGSDAYGWYAFTFLPWLVLSIGGVFNESKNNISVLSLFGVLITIPSQILIGKLELIKTIPDLTKIWRWGFAFYLFLILMTYSTKNPKLVFVLKILTFFWLALSLLLSIKYSLNLNPQTWLGIN